VAIAPQHPFDVIFMDVQMPGMDGFEATARIREQQQAAGRRVPIVAVTANAMRGDRQRCLDAGMDDYLAKPITRAGLYEQVQRWAGAASQGAAPVPQPPSPVATPATPAALASPATPTALDLAQLRSIVGDEPARIAEFVEMFVTLTAPLVDEFVHAVTAGDIEATRRAAHKLKGSCGSAGARELAAIGARAERAAQEGDAAALQDCASQIAPALDRVRALQREGAADSAPLGVA
jgi:HPt (histidine-containing phosphotransfer) domain-containing protein